MDIGRRCGNTAGGGVLAPIHRPLRHSGASEGRARNPFAGWVRSEMDSGFVLRTPRNDSKYLAPRPVPRFHTLMFTTFRGGQSGAWRVVSQAAVKGAGLLSTPALSTVESTSIALPILPSQTSWRLAGVASHGRYVERAEKQQLAAVQAGLGRPEAT